jgi:hypothetical protein
LTVVLIFFPEVQLQTTFQQKNASAETDRSPAETFEVGTDRKILSFDSVDAIRTAAM